MLVLVVLVVVGVGGAHGEIWDSALQMVRKGSDRGPSANQRLQEPSCREELLCSSHRRGALGGWSLVTPRTRPANDGKKDPLSTGF